MRSDGLFLEGRVLRKIVSVAFLGPAPPALFVPTPAKLRLALMRAERMPVHYYRYLYDTIGRDHVWVDRKRLTDQALAAEISAPDVEIFVLYAGGVPAGFFELDRAHQRVTWLRYFGGPAWPEARASARNLPTAPRSAASTPITTSTSAPFRTIHTEGLESMTRTSSERERPGRARGNRWPKVSA